MKFNMLDDLIEQRNKFIDDQEKDTRIEIKSRSTEVIIVEYECPKCMEWGNECDHCTACNFNYDTEIYK